MKPDSPLKMKTKLCWIRGGLLAAFQAPRSSVPTTGSSIGSREGWWNPGGSGWEI